MYHREQFRHYTQLWQSLWSKHFAFRITCIFISVLFSSTFLYWVVLSVTSAANKSFLFFFLFFCSIELQVVDKVLCKFLSGDKLNSLTGILFGFHTNKIVGYWQDVPSTYMQTSSIFECVRYSQFAMSYNNTLRLYSCTRIRNEAFTFWCLYIRFVQKNFIHEKWGNKTSQSPNHRLHILSDFSQISHIKLQNEFHQIERNIDF